MTWFDHTHYWRELQQLTVEPSATTGKPTKVVFVMICGCGAVRQIEIVPGQAPAIFMTVQP